MKSKKSQLAFVVDLVVIVMLAFVFLNFKYMGTQIVKIGAVQQDFLNSYWDGEETREYLSLAGRLSVYNLASQFGATSGAGCFNEIDMQEFERLLSARMAAHAASYDQSMSASYTGVLFPQYQYFTERGADSITIQAKPTGQEEQASVGSIIFENKAINFRYGLTGYWTQTVTCDDYTDWAEVRSSNS